MSNYSPPSGAPPSKQQEASSSAAANAFEDDLPAYTKDDAAELFVPTATEVPAYVPLTNAVALPQIGTGFGAPIARAYAPALEASGVSQEDFLNFIDGFNAAAAKSPPVQVADGVGKFIAFIPIISAANGAVGSTSGQHMLEKGLTDKYLRHNNETFFKPRGLTVRLLKTRALRQLVGKDELKGEPSALAKAGSVATAVGLHLPVIRKVLNRALPAPEASRQQLPFGADGVDRRLASLDGFIAPVNRNVPPPSTTGALADKMRAWSATRNRDVNNERRLQMGAVRSGQMPALAVQPGSSSGVYDRRVYKDDRRAFKAERRAQRDAYRGRGPSFAQQGRQQLQQRKAEIADNKIVWLVVLSKEQDDLIQGREDVDGEADQVAVSDDEWNEVEAEERAQAEEENELERAEAAPVKN